MQEPRPIVKGVPNEFFYGDDWVAPLGAAVSRAVLGICTCLWRPLGRKRGAQLVQTPGRAGQVRSFTRSASPRMVSIGVGAARAPSLSPSVPQSLRPRQHLSRTSDWPMRSRLASVDNPEGPETMHRTRFKQVMSPGETIVANWWQDGR